MRYSVELPSISQQVSPRMMWFKIDGSALTTTSSSAGLVAGFSAADAKDDGSNTVTITFKEGLQSTPLGMSFHPVSTTPVIASDVTLSKTSVVYSTVNSTSDAAVANVDGLVIVYYLEGVDVL